MPIELRFQKMIKNWINTILFLVIPFVIGIIIALFLDSVFYIYWDIAFLLFYLAFGLYFGLFGIL